jgi:hypothetical protein
MSADPRGCGAPNARRREPDHLKTMQRKRKEVKLPIAAYVAARNAEAARPATPEALDWIPAETPEFYRPLTRPLTLSQEAMEQLRRGEGREQ